MRESTVPSFAVVGRPNKGKSSIVATLARDDSVHIAAKAGSTRAMRRFPMRIDGETLYELVDTPGLQRARSVLAWLEQHNDNAASRPDTVLQFLAEFADDPQYQHECQALTPVVEGAGIIYVVDGSCPFGADYEAEMEILRWTGRPSLALINPIENTDYVQEWRAGLGQYFQTVRTFDAHRAEHRKQLELLELFGHLDPEWQQPLKRAVEVLEADRVAQHEGAAYLITDLLVDALTYSARQKIPEGAPEAPVKSLLFTQYKRHLVGQENHCRRQVEELFYYRELKTSEEGITLEGEDLFNQQNWYLWGLNKRQLLIAAASAGGVVGGGAGLVLDGATGGLTGGLGTLLSGAGGAWASARSAMKHADDIAQWKLSGIPSGGTVLAYGPSRNVNFPFVIMGRAMQHHRMISQRTHAVRETLKLDSSALDWLSDKERRNLARIFDDIREDRKAAQRRTELAQMLRQWCLDVDQY
jgi:GTPase Era involved in 16S rRNA processing